MSYISAVLRRQVIERAGSCCEYCLLNRDDHILPFEIDHVIAEKHNGQTILENLSYSCFDCNNAKGSDLASIDPQTGNPTFIFNPRKHLWSDHFLLNAGQIEGLTAEGRATIFFA